MAIQVRRGNYADLDISKLTQGEPFVTLDQVGGNYYVGMAIAPNNVLRLATYDDLTDIKTDCESARDDAIAAKGDAETAETSAETSANNAEAWAVGERGGVPVTSGDDTYHNNSKYYSEQASTAWQNIETAIETVVPTVWIDFTDGILYYTGSSLGFFIDNSTGNLCWEVIE